MNRFKSVIIIVIITTLLVVGVLICGCTDKFTDKSAQPPSVKGNYTTVWEPQDVGALSQRIDKVYLTDDNVTCYLTSGSSYANGISCLNGKL